MRSQPYGLLRDILARRLQIADDDSMEAAKAKLESGACAFFSRRRCVDLGGRHTPTCWAI